MDKSDDSPGTAWSFPPAAMEVKVFPPAAPDLINAAEQYESLVMTAEGERQAEIRSASSASDRGRADWRRGASDVPSEIGKDGNLRLGRGREGGDSALSAKDGGGNGSGREDKEGGDELREEHRSGKAE